MTRGLDPTELSWRLPFRARLTGQSTVGGLRRYTWVEQSVDPSTGDTEDAEFAREGTADTNWALELNNADVPDDTIVWLRFRCMTEGRPTYEFLAPTTGTGAGPLTVQEADGSPAVLNVTTITTNQTQGLRTTSGGTGIAALSVDDASTSQTGVVNTSAQSFNGRKFFDDETIFCATYPVPNIVFQTAGTGTWATTYGTGRFFNDASSMFVEFSTVLSSANTGPKLLLAHDKGTGTNSYRFFSQTAGVAGQPEVQVGTSGGAKTGKTGTFLGMEFTSGWLTNDNGVSSSEPTGGSGEANTASNVGSGSGWYKTKSGVDLQFKSVVAGTGITVTSNTNDITISLTNTAVTPPGGGGTPGVVPIWDGTTSLEDSGVTDNGTTIGFTRAIAGATSAVAGGVTDYDDLDPSGKVVLFVNLTSASANLSGITGGTDGRLLVIQNTSSSKTLTLKHDTTSTAANRFYLPGSTDYVLGPYKGVVAVYNGTLSRWLVAGGA